MNWSPNPLFGKVDPGTTVNNSIIRPCYTVTLFRETATRYRIRLKLHRVTPSLLWKIFKKFPETVSRKVEQHPTRATAPRVSAAMWHDAIASWNFLQQVPSLTFNPFTPKSDQFQIFPPASPEILHRTVWRTWLFMAYSDERLVYYQFSLSHFYISL